jgi:hypothetical protein
LEEILPVHNALGRFTPRCFGTPRIAISLRAKRLPGFALSKTLQIHSKLTEDSCEADQINFLSLTRLLIRRRGAQQERRHYRSGGLGATAPMNAFIFKFQQNIL